MQKIFCDNCNKENDQNNQCEKFRLTDEYKNFMSEKDICSDCLQKYRTQTRKINDSFDTALESLEKSMPIFNDKYAKKEKGKQVGKVGESENLGKT